MGALFFVAVANGVTTRHDGCMSDEPVKGTEKRNPDGTFVKGHVPVSPGRPRLPDWFKSRGPDALRVLIAQATGEEVQSDDGSVLPAVTQVAKDSSPKERAQAADLIANRVYGKAPDVISGDPDNPVRACLRIEFVKPEKTE